MMWRVRQSFDTLGDDCARTFARRFAALRYVVQLRREIAARVAESDIPDAGKFADWPMPVDIPTKCHDCHYPARPFNALLATYRKRLPQPPLAPHTALCGRPTARALAAHGVRVKRRLGMPQCR